MTKPTPANTKRPDPELADYCQDLAEVAQLEHQATDAVLVNANRLRLNLNLPRGGTILLIRFPSAAIRRDEQPLCTVLGPRVRDLRPPQALAYEILPTAEVLDGQSPTYQVDRPQIDEEPPCKP